MALVESRTPAIGWLRNRDFDLVLICGVAAAALAAGGLIAAMPAAIGFILFVDVWLLGGPHVAATFVRLAPDKVGLSTHRFLVFVLPVIVLAAISALAIGVGITLVATIYFYWQWYHTLRQSWGIAQLYRRRSSVPVREHPLFAEGLFALVALWGLLHRLTTDSEYAIFPNLPLSLPLIPVWFADGVVGTAAVLGLAFWAIGRIREYWAGELATAHALFSASHYLIFIVGYVVMDNVAGGWLVTNIWHTAQYLMLVWMFNESTAAKSQAPDGWFRRATAGNKAGWYFLLCFLMAFPFYLAFTVTPAWGGASIAIAFVANQTLTFHHFIVDAVIWRARRKTVGTPA